MMRLASVSEEDGRSYDFLQRLDSLPVAFDDSQNLPPLVMIATEIRLL